MLGIKRFPITSWNSSVGQKDHWLVSSFWEFGLEHMVCEWEL
jgi:hypothetical protein